MIPVSDPAEDDILHPLPFVKNLFVRQRHRQVATIDESQLAFAITGVLLNSRVEGAAQALDHEPIADEDVNPGRAALHLNTHLESESQQPESH